mmetsp:Transcript_67555/g.208984  ORF Transcript_67555/g.208984 Transcript_67555/m.208984 type:complete len:267 (-) Transcript_67555:162-962(-)
MLHCRRTAAVNSARLRVPSLFTSSSLNSRRFLLTSSIGKCWVFASITSSWNSLCSSSSSGWRPPADSRRSVPLKKCRPLPSHVTGSGCLSPHSQQNLAAEMSLLPHLVHAPTTDLDRERCDTGVSMTSIVRLRDGCLEDSSASSSRVWVASSLSTSPRRMLGTVRSRARATRQRKLLKKSGPTPCRPWRPRLRCSSMVSSKALCTQEVTRRKLGRLSRGMCCRMSSVKRTSLQRSIFLMDGRHPTILRKASEMNRLSRRLSPQCRQ